MNKKTTQKIKQTHNSFTTAQQKRQKSTRKQTKPLLKHTYRLKTTSIAKNKLIELAN
ncbi:hypothetical protein [Pseudoalteromonas phenolica]|uniref:hypothetical protein n=1 Tax=Pseudoalteromonas phenolica TaxID=161398 RepID=UPI0019D43715|nr:hypothetical protein [Pseudoalteromonas phenolica]